jgi:pimeloyl-ACP methyl ester carboxylesterase
MAPTAATPPVLAPRLRFSDVTSADGTRLRVWTNDADGPAVLVCNGLGTSPYVWPALLDPDCGIRVVSWNHRGIGGSARPDDPTKVGIQEYVDDAVAVLDHAGIGSCVVAGWSFGVNTAFELAVRHPHRVRGLFAVAGVPGNTFGAMLEPFRMPRVVRRGLTVGSARALRRGGRFLTPITTRVPLTAWNLALLRYSGFMFPAARTDVVRPAVQEFLTTPVEWYMHLALEASRHRRVPLSGIDVPATFVAGRWDVLSGAKEMAGAAERMQRATYVELRGGHFLPLEQPEAIHRELHKLIRRANAREN